MTETWYSEGLRLVGTFFSFRPIKENRMRLICAVGLALLTATTLPQSISGQTPDQCAAALSQTGRNHLLQINDVDIRAYYYKKICETDLTSFGMNGSSVIKELLAQASSLLALSYSNQKQYCDEEKKYVSNHSFSYVRTSIVVEKALDNWLECVRLASKGIRLTPKVFPQQIVMGIERAGRTTGKISGVSSTPGITCTAWVTTVQGQLEKINLSNNSYTLSDTDSLTVICDRTAHESTEGSGAMIYPDGLVTVVTSEGPFTFSLPEEPRGPETWAKDIDSRIASLQTSTSNQISAIEDRLSRLGPIGLADC